MPLQQHHIEELKRLHKEDFHEELSDEEAWAMGTNLVNLFRLLLKADVQSNKKVRTE